MAELSQYQQWIMFLDADEMIEWREEALKIALGDDAYYDMRGKQGYNFGQLEMKL